MRTEATRSNDVKPSKEKAPRVASNDSKGVLFTQPTKEEERDMVALKTKTSKATKTSETTRTPEQVAKSELYDTSHQLHNLQQLDRDRCKAVANALNELDGYLVGIRQDLDDLFHLTREALDKAIDVAMPVDKAKWEQDRLEAHEHFAGLLSSVRAAERYSATINTECSKRVVSA